MTLECRFRPLERWPRQQTPSYRQKPAPFRAGYSNTLEMLAWELKQLKARNVVIEADFQTRDIRNDGWPRSSARPKSPGIILSFESRFGAMTLPCDHFNAWEDNLRAIAFHLLHLRKSDMYGVAQGGEQYRGWQALPGSSEQAITTLDDAALFIAHHAGVSESSTIAAIKLNTSGFRDYYYRIAAQKLHPDKGGTTALFQQLQHAITLLRS